MLPEIGGKFPNMMDNPNGPTEAGHPKMVTDLKSSFERRDDPDVLKISLI